MTQLFTGNLPGVGLAVASTTFDPIAVRSFCLDGVYLGCCPIGLDLRLTAVDGTVWTSPLAIGQQDRHYSEVTNTDRMADFSGQTLGRVNKAELIQRVDICTGEPYEVKVGLIVSDFYSPTDVSCVCAQTCGGGSAYSYVQVW